MNKTLILLLTMVYSTYTFSETEKDTPSIGDIIGEVLKGDNQYKAYQTIIENEGSVCIDNNLLSLDQPVDENAFDHAWNLNCLIIKNSKLCSAIKKDDQLICDKPQKQKWYANTWEKTKSCGAGIKKSWQEYYQFVKGMSQYVLNSEKEVKEKKDAKEITSVKEDIEVTATKDNEEVAKPVKTVKTRDDINEKIAKGYNTMKMYLSTETTKHQDKYSVSRSKAFSSVTKNLFKKFTKGLNQLLAASAPKVGCYNYKARTRVTCQILAEFFVQPLLMFKFIKVGPKALKGTRAAKFFKYHGSNVARKVAAKGRVVKNKLSPPPNIDFIPSDSAVGVKILENPELLESVAKNKEVFNEIFPDKDSLDELANFLDLNSKLEADDLARIMNELKRDKKLLSTDQYNDYVSDIRKAIKNKCSI